MFAESQRHAMIPVGSVSYYPDPSTQQKTLRRLQLDQAKQVSPPTGNVNTQVRERGFPLMGHETRQASLGEVRMLLGIIDWRRTRLHANKQSRQGGGEREWRNLFGIRLSWEYAYF